jgi:replicative DNA helicase
MKLEQTVLRNLILSDNYSKKVLPFLKSEYFSQDEERAMFQAVEGFILKYNMPPSFDSIEIEINETSWLSETQIDTCLEYLKDYRNDNVKTNEEWLLDTTEKFCQEKAVYLALTESIEIMNSTKHTMDKGAIPGILSDALAISFDTHIGHDYIEDSNDRFAYYHRTDTKIPFSLEYFNKITKGGCYSKTLNIILGGTGTGKTLMMCDFAASYLNSGKNVLYITLEMAEEQIASRIDANLLNVDIGDLENLSQEMYQDKIEKVRAKTDGKLIIKEFATATAGAMHFKNLLNELKLKKGFKPDVIFIDYINLCVSTRFKGGATGMYQYVKAIAEELRGLAVEEEVIMWSATQVNREGFGDSNPDLTNTAESFGLPATADLMFVVITDEDLAKLGQYMIKQLKNRYNSVTLNTKFMIGVDYIKMRLHDVEQNAQTNVSGANQITTNKPTSKLDKFKSIKV